MIRLDSIKKSNISGENVDEIIMGQVLTGGAGQNPARQAAIKSGIPKEKPAYIVNQVCGSGIRSIASAYQSIKSGDSKIIIAGGQENMSLAPHSIHLRDGKKLGDTQLIDTMIKDGLWDAFHGYHMGVTAENVANKFQVTRREQDNFALKSQEKALKAIKEKKFQEEIINFKIKSKKAEIDFNKDEHPREGINMEGLTRLKPVFQKDGTVTAGNASGINDGAAAVALMSEEEAKKRNLKLIDINNNYKRFMNFSNYLKSDFKIRNLTMAVEAVKLSGLKEKFVHRSLGKIKGVPKTIQIDKKNSSLIDMFTSNIEQATSSWFDELPAYRWKME